MKLEIILALVWTSFCFCERQQRSTVLTDEYKRVLEHFDFSNFDKQEALNYIDRQRYENQVRGKRSHSKFKRDHDKTGKISDMTARDNYLSNNLKIYKAVTPNLKFQICKKVNNPKKVSVPRSPTEMCIDRETPTTLIVRNKRGHRCKKKHRSKFTQNDFEGGEDYADELESKFRRHRKRKKKKKRKRHYWDHWTEWSPCSVTCGRGRKIRWRKCIVKNCTTGELEMGEKTCQLPACNLLTKLLGL